MIFYLTTARNAPVMQAFLDGAGRAAASRITLRTYESLSAPRQVPLPRGVYVFTSLRQSLGSVHPPSPERQWAMRLHAFLTGHHGPQCVLNDPGRSLGRLDLLRALHAAGINRFTAHRAIDDPVRMRFPVFLRAGLGSMQEAPPLLPDAATLAASLPARADPDLIAVEHHARADSDGLHRKYGCFVVGGRLVPRHLFVSRSWMVKGPDLLTSATLAEELAYLDTCPHADVLARAASIARIGYGRIDYGVIDGVPQIWEINVTPGLINVPVSGLDPRAAVHERFAAAFVAALDALDPSTW